MFCSCHRHSGMKIRMLNRETQMNSQIFRPFILFLLFWFTMTVTGCADGHFTVVNKKADLPHPDFY